MDLAHERLYPDEPRFPDMRVAIGADVPGAGDMIRAVTTGRLVALRDGHVRLIGVIAMLSGCFYVPSVNQRPGLEIRSNGATLVRGGSATFEAVVVDPEADAVDLQWRAYLCKGPAPVDPSEFGDCDQEPFFDGIGAEFEIPYIEPKTRESDAVTTGIRVTLDGQDDRGASAKPAQRIAIAVENAPPEVRFPPDAIESKFGQTVDTPLRAFVAYGDVDDTPENVTLTWEVFAPTEVPFDPPTPVPPEQVPSPPEGLAQEGIEFTPTVEGNWQVRVTATDAAQAVVSVTNIVVVVADGAPCLTAEMPTIFEGSTLPVFEPTLFSSSVTDNLDAWPAATGDDLFGSALFTWSVKAGAGPRDIVVESQEQNSYAFDPTAYSVGTIVEIRVEIEDRVERTLACPDTDAACAVVTGSGCFQRRTWRVEAR